MNLKIEVVSADVRVINGKKKDGNPFTMRKQEGYLHNGHHYPERFEITLGRDAGGVDAPAYAPGFYSIAPSSIRVNGQFQSLEVDPYNLKLIPLVAEVKPAKVG